MQHHQFYSKRSNFLPLLKHFGWAFLHVNFKHQNTLTKSLPTLSPKYSQTKRDGRDALPLQMCPCLEESPPETMATTLAVPIYPSSQEIGEPWCTPTRSLLQEAEPEAPLQLHPNMFQPQTMLQPWMEPLDQWLVSSFPFAAAPNYLLLWRHSLQHIDAKLRRDESTSGGSEMLWLCQIPFKIS